MNMLDRITQMIGGPRHTCPFCGEFATAIVERRCPSKVLHVCRTSLATCRLFRKMYKVLYVPWTN
jgi:hypothetical protein